MSEQEKMDRLLRQSMGAVPPPRLSSAFDRRLVKRLHPRRLSSAGRLAMTLYALLALIVSVWVMRSEAIDWIPIVIAILAPPMLAAAVQYRQRTLSS